MKIKFLQNTKENRDYLESLPKLYLIGCWAHWGVMEFPFDGKFDKKKSYEPWVWQYNDYNGTTDQFELVPLHWTTTGRIVGFTFHKSDADYIADKLRNFHSK